MTLAVYANLRPGSYARFPKWYQRSALAIFLQLPPEQVTYEATLNALTYLQPERTRPWEAELYRRVLQTFHYRRKRVDIDSTGNELGGKLCQVLAKFGRAKTGTTSQRRQILVTFMVDQRGSLLGDELFPGNTNDAKTLASVNCRPRTDYEKEVATAPRVVDRGYANEKKVRELRRKEPFLVALRSKPKGLKLLEELGSWKRWTGIRPWVGATFLEREGVKWVVTWNEEVAGRNGDGRAAKLRKAMEDLAHQAKAVREGRVKSRSERDRKAVAILRKHGMARFPRVKGMRDGFGFTVEETEGLVTKGEEDGYQVYAATERWLTEGEVVDSYRSWDRIEKAIWKVS